VLVTNTEFYKQNIKFLIEMYINISFLPENFELTLVYVRKYRDKNNYSMKLEQNY